MFGDLMVITACVSGLVIGGVAGYRNHSGSHDGALECMEIALYLAVLPCLAAFAAMFYGNIVLMVACLLSAIGAGVVWFVAYFFVLFA